MKRALQGLAAVALLTAAFGLAAAEDAAQTPGGPAAAPPAPATTAPTPCKLYSLTSLDITTEPDGRIAIPATVEDREGLLMVDTGGIYTVLGESEALARNLSVRLSNQQLYYAGGVPLYQMTRIGLMKLGPLTGHDLSVMVVASSQQDHNIIGALGPDIMSNYDVDFDFASGTLKFFDPDHCPGQVVYWTHTPYAAVPMKPDTDRQIVITVTLDGKQVDALLDTGAYRSTISMKVAHALFGIDSRDPKIKSMGDISVNGTTPAPLYRYPFGTLTLEGVTVQKPTIDILDDARFDVGKSQMTLGIKTLRRLHVYISYKENMVYFTPAEAR